MKLLTTCDFERCGPLLICHRCGRSLRAKFAPSQCHYDCPAEFDGQLTGRGMALLPVVPGERYAMLMLDAPELAAEWQMQSMGCGCSTKGNKSEHLWLRFLTAHFRER